MLEVIFKSHKKWINTVLKFNCSKEEAEDIVGQMYLIIGKMLKKGLNITYGDEVNYYYIYLTLKTTFLQMKNKKKKENKANSISIDYLNELDELDFLEAPEFIDFDVANELVLDELDKMHWYNKKVFNKVQDGTSLTELSKESGIDYHSLYNTNRRVKEILKDKLLKNI